ncbi:hypothetical protein NQZ68_039736 [Dissostichus eleginoides]|nr:hypothetical protein NQZ68_039736 [Dissostichus eleginoides]
MRNNMFLITGQSWTAEWNFPEDGVLSLGRRRKLYWRGFFEVQSYLRNNFDQKFKGGMSDKGAITVPLQSVDQSEQSVDQSEQSVSPGSCFYSSASRSVESEGQGCLSSAGVERRICTEGIAEWPEGSPRSGWGLLLPVLYCCSGGLRTPVLCCCGEEDFAPETSRREGAAPRFSGWGLLSTFPVSAVAETCFYLSCAAVLRRSYPRDIAERRSGSMFGLGPAFHLSCFCCSGGLLPPVVCCCAEEDFTPGTSRRDRSASTFRRGPAFA